MSTATASKHHPSTFERQSVFARPLVGVDGSDEVIEAARQAAILADGPLVLLGSTTSRRGSSGQPEHASRQISTATSRSVRRRPSIERDKRWV